MSAGSASKGQGGVAARRAVVRWAWRLFRREWRQQLLIIALLVVAVGSSIVGSAVAVDTPPSDQREFGLAHDVLTLFSPGATLPSVLASLAREVGPLEVVENRSISSGVALPIELRAESPTGRYTKPLLSLVSGRFPRGAHQVALTAAVASAYDVGLGDTWHAGAGARRVVGIVEDPQNYADDFALVAPGQVTSPTAVSVYFDATAAELNRLNAEGRLPSGSSLATLGAPGSQSGGFDPAFVALAVETFGLLFIALVSVAGFSVLANRRRRALGMLGAIGATDRHVRLVMVANGVIVGVVGAVAGLVVGWLSWIAYRPHLELSASHVIALGALPWVEIAIGAALAILASTWASRAPARAAARTPILDALSGRPEAQRHRVVSTLRGALLVAAGALLLALAGSSRNGGGLAPIELVVGLVLLTVGALSFTLTAVGALEPVAKWVPVSIRLAWRDVARYRSRSAAALGAITFVVMVAVITVVASAARYANPVDYFGPNLPSDQLLVYAPQWGDNGFSGGPNGAGPASTASPALRVAVARVAASLAGSEVVPLVATTQTVCQRDPHGVLCSGSVLYVATPALLRHYGISEGAVAKGTVLVTSRPGLEGTSGLFLTTPGCGAGSPVTGRNSLSRCVVNPRIQTFSSLPLDINDPNLLVTVAAVERYHLATYDAVWMIQARQPLSAVQINTARQLAAGVGATIETKNDNPSLAELSDLAVAFSAILTLGVLAMTLGLLRSETDRYQRVLAAAGATSYLRRAMAASTASTLALVGAVLATVVAYLGLLALQFRSPSSNVDLGAVPVHSLLLIVVVMPIVAGIGGWLFAGRAPEALSRQPLE